MKTEQNFVILKKKNCKKIARRYIKKEAVTRRKRPEQSKSPGSKKAENNTERVLESLKTNFNVLKKKESQKKKTRI